MDNKELYYLIESMKLNKIENKITLNMNKEVHSCNDILKNRGIIYKTDNFSLIFTNRNKINTNLKINQKSNFSSITNTYNHQLVTSLKNEMYNETNNTNRIWAVYRCELNTNPKKDICCCSCNSDAMFEVMKGLYDCYKKKNCNNCKCVLCGHMPEEEKQLEVLKKSQGDGAIIGLPRDIRQEEKTQRLEEKTYPREDRTRPGEKPILEKDKVKEPAQAKGIEVMPTAQAKTTEPIELEKIRKTARELGLLTPSLGNTPSEKDKIRQSRAKKASTSQKQRIRQEAAAVGIDIPEKIKAPQKDKVKKEAKEKQATKKNKEKVITSDKCICTLTPSTEKKILTKEPEEKKIKDVHDVGKISRGSKVTPDEISKDLKAAHKAGITSPEQQDKMKDKHIASKSPTSTDKIRKEARALGLITPSEGQSPSEKEKIQKQRAKKAPVEQQNKVRREAITAGIIPPQPEVKEIRKRTDKEKEGAKPKKIDKGKPESKESKLLSDECACVILAKVGKKISKKDQIKKDKPEKKKAKEDDLAKKEEKKKISAEQLERKRSKLVDEMSKSIKAAQKSGVISSPKQAADINLPKGSEKVKKQQDRIEEKVIGKPKKGDKAMPKTKESKLSSDECACVILTKVEKKGKKEKKKKESHKPKVSPEKEKIKHDMQVTKSLSTPDKITSADVEKIKKNAREFGILTPSIGATASEKEKIRISRARKASPNEEQRIREAAKTAGIKLPVKKTSSAKDGTQKAMLKKEARDAGIMTPSIGKSPSEKEKIRRKRSQLKRSSEKERIKQALQSAGIKAHLERPTPEEREKIKKLARVAGLMTPSIGKTPSDKEKIRKSRGDKYPKAEQEQIRQRAQAAGIIPIKTDSKILPKKQVSTSVKSIVLTKKPAEDVKKKDKKLKEKLKQARIYSDICLCKKILESQDLKKPTKGKSKRKAEKKGEPIRDARVSRSLTPPTGKTDSAKDKVRKPQPKTSPSAKQKHEKVIEGADLRNADKKEREKIAQQARAAGLLTPLEGKTPSEKVKLKKTRAMNTPSSEKQQILKLARNAGMVDWTPSGKTKILSSKASQVNIPKLSSEKLDKKKPIKDTKEKVKTKERASITSKKLFKSLSDVVEKKVGGPKIKCDKACGCEKIKMKFKHSYVKIKVTAPDISSLCPCPDDCVPTGKHGNEGIKVTVGTALVFDRNNNEFSGNNYNLAKKDNSIETIYINQSYSNSLFSNYTTDQYLCTSENSLKAKLILHYVVSQRSFSKPYRCVKSLVNINNYEQNNRAQVYRHIFDTSLKISNQYFKNSILLRSISISRESITTHISECKSDLQDFSYISIIHDKFNSLNILNESDILSEGNTNYRYYENSFISISESSSYQVLNGIDEIDIKNCSCLSNDIKRDMHNFIEQNKFTNNNYLPHKLRQYVFYKNVCDMRIYRDETDIKYFIKKILETNEFLEPKTNSIFIIIPLRYKTFKYDNKLNEKINKENNYLLGSFNLRIDKVKISKIVFILQF